MWVKVPRLFLGARRKYKVMWGGGQGGTGGGEKGSWAEGSDWGYDTCYQLCFPSFSYHRLCLERKAVSLRHRHTHTEVFPVRGVRWPNSIMDDWLSPQVGPFFLMWSSCYFHFFFSSLHYCATLFSGADPEPFVTSENLYPSGNNYFYCDLVNCWVALSTILISFAGHSIEWYAVWIQHLMALK